MAIDPSQTSAQQGLLSENPGSGSITNLDFYLKANQTAGQVMAEAIQKGVTRELAQTLKSAQNANTALEVVVESITDAVTLGEHYLSLAQESVIPATPTSDPAFDAEAIANDPKQLKEYLSVTQGNLYSNVQISLINSENNATTTATTYSELVNERYTEVTNPDSRYTLLLKYIANPRVAYTSGIAALDNALIQNDPSGTLSNLEDQLTIDKNETLINLEQSNTNLTQEGTTGLTELQTLGTKLQTQSDNNYNDYYDYLNDTILPAVNTDRATEYTYLTNQWALLQASDDSVTRNIVDSGFADTLGLTTFPPEIVWNVARDNALPVVVEFNDLQFTSPNQAANDDERAYATALAKLASITDPTITPTPPDDLSLINNHDELDTLIAASGPDTTVFVIAWNDGIGDDGTATTDAGTVYNFLHTHESTLYSTLVAVQKLINQYGVSYGTGTGVTVGIDDGSSNIARFGNLSATVPCPAILNTFIQTITGTVGHNANVGLTDDNILGISRGTAFLQALNSLYTSGYFKRVNIS